MSQTKITNAKNLRKHGTDAKMELWYHLRSKRFDGFKFRRQHPIGSFIVDFVCLQNQLIIECDGSQHLESEDDLRRTEWLESEGYTVLRFWNHHILQDTKSVLAKIWEHCHPPHAPLPSREGEDLFMTLVPKHDRPGPRYTSYPTAPEWTADVGEADFWAALAESNTKAAPLSLYVHLPFCEEHCTFCGCATVITKKRAVTTPYLTHLFREIDLIADRVDNARPVVQLHWGGGTPTYFTSDEIRQLMDKIRARFRFAMDAEISVEVDPRVTTHDQLNLMRELGVNRISMGVQDFNPQVQASVNRIQPETMTRLMIDRCRELGYHSVNTDLIYGLPHQTIESFREMVAKLIEMQPDRVALFNFAYVPWMKKQQNAIDPKTLPAPAEKFQIFRDAIQAFTNAGYLFIGMDHFAKPNDELSAALKERRLSRNFQGYTTRMDQADMISFGITAISDINGCYFQNKKILARYYADIDSGHLSIERGKRCSADDLLRRDLIMDLFCNTHIHKDRIAKHHHIDFDNYFATELKDLLSFANDGLIEMTRDHITVTDNGRLFIRNIAMVFDNYLRNKASPPRKFSRTL